MTTTVTLSDLTDEAFRALYQLTEAAEYSAHDGERDTYLFADGSVIVWGDETVIVTSAEA